jgi:hypothetical protein
VRFWDASAIVPLLVDEEITKTAEKLYREDPHLCVSWTTLLECTSAVVRREREDLLDPASVELALGRLRALAERWEEVLPTDDLRTDALRLLRVHPLRVADSFQLASAFALGRGRPGRFPFVCADRRLSDAAAREGFLVIPVVPRTR